MRSNQGSIEYMCQDTHKDWTNSLCREQQNWNCACGSTTSVVAVQLIIFKEKWQRWILLIWKRASMLQYTEFLWAICHWSKSAGSWDFHDGKKTLWTDRPTTMSNISLSWRSHPWRVFIDNVWRLWPTASNNGPVILICQIPPTMLLTKHWPSYEAEWRRWWSNTFLKNSSTVKK